MGFALGEANVAANEIVLSGLGASKPIGRLFQAEARFVLYDHLMVGVVARSGHVDRKMPHLGCCGVYQWVCRAGELHLSWVNYIFAAFALVLLVPVAVFCAECIASLMPRRLIRKNSAASVAGRNPTIAVLIPAHNEEVVLAETLASLMPQITESNRVIVVADNCNDDTAKIARSFGAIVLERHDTQNRGKGFALDHGILALKQDAPDILVMMDADCTIHEGAIAALVNQVSATGRPAQACYLMESPANPGPRDCVSALAFLVKNLVRPRGLFQLGLPCLLTGTGMAFPWSAISRAKLASGNIVEDMQLGLDLALEGSAPLFCGEARVTGHLPRQQQIAYGQRTRWEHGHLQTLLSQAPRMFKAGLVNRRLQAMALALELSVPPLALLMMALIGSLCVCSVAGFLGAGWLAAKLLGIGILAVVTCLLCAWAKFGRKIVPMSGLVAAPVYMAWKVPMYFAFLFKPQTEWNRTARGEENDAASPIFPLPTVASVNGFELLPAGVGNQLDLNRDIPTGIPVPAMGIPAMSLARFELGRLGRRAVNAAQCVKHVLAELDAGRGGIVVQPTAEHLSWCDRDAEFAAVMASAELVIAGGLPLAWASRLHGTPLPNRDAGAELCWDLIDAASTNRRSVFMLGDDARITLEAANAVRNRFPHLMLAGTYDAPNGFDSHHEAFQHVAGALRQATPDIVLVALGTPKQERLIAKLREKMPRTWWLTVGNSFECLREDTRRVLAPSARFDDDAQTPFSADPANLGRQYLSGGMPFAASLLGQVAIKRLARILSQSAPQEKALRKALEVGIDHLAIAETATEMDREISTPSAKTSSLDPAIAGPAMVYQSFLKGFMSELASSEIGGEFSPRSHELDAGSLAALRTGPLGRLRAVVLLSGSVRPSRLSLALGRSTLDLPLEDGRSLLWHWRDHVSALRKLIGLGELPVRVMVDQISLPPSAPHRGTQVHFSIERDASRYRGTAGVLRDLSEHYNDDDYILVANGAQALITPLTDLTLALSEPMTDVTLVSHEDGSPSGIMFIRCEALRHVAVNGYVDMKEQALPYLASMFNVRHLPHAYPTGLPIRSVTEYVAAIQHRYRTRIGKPVCNNPFAEDCRPSFAVIEEGAYVHPSANVHDSVILRGAHVSENTVVVRSVIGPDIRLSRGEHIIDQLVAGEIFASLPAAIPQNALGGVGAVRLAAR